MESMKDFEKELEVTEDMQKWNGFKAMLDEKAIITVTIKEAVKAGVVTYIDDVRAFIPASQLSTSYVEDLNAWVDKEIDVMVITAEPENKRLVLSGRNAARAKAREARKQAIAQMVPGTIMEGVVESLQPYGAFVTLAEGISGLVHVSQISEKRIKTPEDVLKIGDTVKVKILNVKDGKVSLTMKNLDAAPAEEAEDEVPDIKEYISKEKATTSLGALLANIKLN